MPAAARPRPARGAIVRHTLAAAALVLSLGALPFAAPAGAALAQGCATADPAVERDVAAAASAYMRAEYPEVFQDAIVRRVEGDWARVRVVARVESDPTSLILHRPEAEG